MSYYDNDEDLFSYDPDLDSEKDNALNYNSFEQASKLTQDDLKLEDVLDVLKINLATAYHSATANHFSAVEQPSLSKATCVVLDKITNGDFTLLHMFYRKEFLIAQRMSFIAMMDIVASETNSQESSTISNFLSKLFSKAGVNITDFHVSIFYGSCVSMARHALVVDQAIYKMLAKKLDLPVKEHLVQTDISPDYALTVSNPVVNDFFNTAFSSATKAMMSDGLDQYLKDHFSIDVRLVSND